MKRKFEGHKMSNSSTGFYADYLKNWQAKACGAKPTAAEFEAAHAIGCKPGTKVAVANAMYFRQSGATQGQVICAVGGPQLNKMRAAVAAGLAARVATPQAGKHTVYKLTLSKPRKAAGKPATGTPKPLEAQVNDAQ